MLNRHDIAVIQHEYGIYGGVDGDDVIGVLAMLPCPRSWCRIPCSPR